MDKAIISLDKWREQIGVTVCTVWRWRKKGWLKTVNICGRQYVNDQERASDDDFAAVESP